VNIEKCVRASYSDVVKQGGREGDKISVGPLGKIRWSEFLPPEDLEDALSAILRAMLMCFLVTEEDHVVADAVTKNWDDWEKGWKGEIDEDREAISLEKLTSLLRNADTWCMESVGGDVEKGREIGGGGSGECEEGGRDAGLLDMTLSFALLGGSEKIPSSIFSLPSSPSSSSFNPSGFLISPPSLQFPLCSSPLEVLQAVRVRADVLRAPLTLALPFSTTEQQHNAWVDRQWVLDQLSRRLKQSENGENDEGKGRRISSLLATLSQPQ